ncbi:DUF2292 domain-containing protein [Brevibacillus fluminis]|uniref:DUF2292 domain-containing protein n=1 Tax=Brevibacillus fluminis TaxID=511487 RepID=A0A3M8DCT6_9BACL|nr:YezD family protein [Brevibacillus fluminis]RNB85401.1 DUF2292 domain-containing protein [Brevibacillus fluminis]
MSKKPEDQNQELVVRILRALEGLEFGSVQIVVHDSQVIQIDRTEKHRFPLEKAQTKTGNTTRIS